MTREFVTARNNRGIRLIAIDLDGTLLNSAGQLPRHSCHLIQKAFGQEIRIILSTTQNYKDVERICAVLAIDDPIICRAIGYLM
jgi:hydroxymethylpyrimidine pyrophosphatase-like HAD family hydrolase